jgi:hypothetical protein
VFISNECLNQFSYKAAIGEEFLTLETNPWFIITTWKTKGNPWTGSQSVKKFKTVPSARKVMLIIFWDARGVLYTEFLTKGSTVN